MTEHFLEVAKLFRAPDHPFGRETRELLLAHGEQPPWPYGLGFALELDRGQPLNFDPLPNVDERCIPEQNLARSSALLQAGGDVDRVSGSQTLLGPGYDLTGVDAHSHRKRCSVLSGKLVVQEPHFVSQLGRCPDGAHSVVLMHKGHTEDSHHGIANELLHTAAVPLDHGAHCRKVAT